LHTYYLFFHFLTQKKESILEGVYPKPKQWSRFYELVNRRYYKDGTFGDDKAGKEIQMTGREYIGLSTDGKAYYNETYGGDK